MDPLETLGKDQVDNSQKYILKKVGLTLPLLFMVFILQQGI